MSYNSDDALRGFNPFEERVHTVPTSAQPRPVPVFTAAVLPDTSKPNLNQNDKAIREINERERALNELEKKIQQREELSRNQNSDDSVKAHNFPPLPRCCPCKPCFYQDFDVEIADEYRGMVKLAFYVWLSYTILLLINVFGTLAFLITAGGSDSATMFGVSLLMFILMPILSFLLWFRALYRGFRSYGSANFFFFFLFFAILIVIDIIQALGINVLGSCGWINSFITLKSNKGVSIFMMVISVGFTCIALVSIFLFVKVHRAYRTTGASFSKAKQEMASKSISAALHA